MSDRDKQRLKALESRRTDKQRLLNSLFARKLDIQEQITLVEKELEELEQDIDALEYQVASQTAQPAASAAVVVVKSEDDNKSSSPVVVSEIKHSSTMTYPDEVLTDPLTMNGGTQADEYLTEPSTQQQPPPVHAQPPSFPAARPSSRGGGSSNIGTLDLVFGRQEPPKKKPPPSTTVAAAGAQTKLDNFFAPRTAAAAAAAPSSNVARPSTSLPMKRSSTATAASRDTSAQAPYDPNAHFRRDNFPWSHEVFRLLRETFRIDSFRDNQKEVINATLSGDDVFVIMRTGGGKSLTYQLPALLEGRGPDRKVTFVISPLLSLIQDQEEQMNQFAPGSATSFTSGLSGGNTEHARRWSLVRDPSQGICLVFVTPEKVHKSKKLQTEMEKLYAQGRLGRFVIDECHCATQMGHDFRPDYVQLGILKSHFPSIPLIAVTATASDKVRDDVCHILRIGTNYRFFRSTANRPNLHYSVRPKKDGKDVVTDMAAFIKENHANDAGIVYTFSRKDADTLADNLCECGIVARSYHSDVTPSNKEYIHRSWMRNETQVVVATIAFGLGINKADVRFVLHHSISKTLDAYYQESGRAGRDGKDADCVLYYSPKDVPRMLKMVHGTSGESLLWSMVRYAQASGNDAICRAIMMAHLGEPICDDIEAFCKQFDGTVTDPRDIGRHGQVVTRLLLSRLEEGEKTTVPMLVKEWRSRSPPPCVQDFPPSQDGLSVEDCERIIIALLIEHVFEPKIEWSAYDSIVYLQLGRRGHDLLRVQNPKIIVRFPKQDDKKPAAKRSKSKESAARKSSPNGEWVAAKSKAEKRKKATKKTKATTVAKKPAKRAKRTSKKENMPSKKNTEKAQPAEVIELVDSDSDSDSSEDVKISSFARGKGNKHDDTLWDTDSDEENEFEG